MMSFRSTRRSAAALLGAGALAFGAVACAEEDPGVDPIDPPPAVDDGGVDGPIDGGVDGAPDGADDGMDGMDDGIDGAPDGADAPAG